MIVFGYVQATLAETTSKGVNIAPWWVELAVGAGLMGLAIWRFPQSTQDLPPGKLSNGQLAFVVVGLAGLVGILDAIGVLRIGS